MFLKRLAVATFLTLENAVLSPLLEAYTAKSNSKYIKDSCWVARCLMSKLRK